MNPSCLYRLAFQGAYSESWYFGAPWSSNITHADSQSWTEGRVQSMSYEAGMANSSGCHDWANKASAIIEFERMMRTQLDHFIGRAEVDAWRANGS